jgi:hypothetical protein
MKREKISFQTEAALCEAFLVWMRRFPEWTAYAETEGWDILLAHCDGTQIGVQAKLRLNVDVLCQAVERRAEWCSNIGPDYRALLVPSDRGVRDLCAALGLTVFCLASSWNAADFAPALEIRSYADWFFMNPKRRHTLPRYIPDVPAGVPSPSPLSKWKIGALEICAVMELRGYVTREDFKRASIDHRRWREQWLAPVDGEPGRWTFKPGFFGFAADHPVVYPQVRDDVAKRVKPHDLIA